MKFNFTKALKSIGNGIVEHSPELLTAAGIAGMFTAIVLAIKATPEATILIEEKKADEEVEKLHPKEVIKTAWKCYIPTAVVATASTVSLICANSTNNKRKAALATAYTLSERALRDYREEVVNLVGEEKEKEISEKATAKRVSKSESSGTVVVTDGKVLCYDRMNDRYFESTLNELERAANKLDRDLRNEMYISLNDFYDEIDLKPTPLGHELGWNVNREHIETLIDTGFTADGRPYLVLDFLDPPNSDFRRL